MGIVRNPQEAEMRGAWWILVGVAAAVGSGCRQSPYMSAQLELMNAEKRALEDELYRAQFEYDDAVRRLQKLERENEKLKGGATTGPARESGGLFPRRDRSSGGSREPEGSQDLAPPMIDEGMLKEPQIEVPSQPTTPELPAPKPPGSGASPGTGAGAQPDSSRTIPSWSNTDRVVPATAFLPAAAAELAPVSSDPRIARIALLPLQTRGYHEDDRPGDDGIVVVVQPQNQAGQFIPLAGPISVVVVDPTRSAAAAAVLARWDLDAQTVQDSLDSSAANRGFRLKLSWPSSPPLVRRVQLQVRYLTLDQRDLRAEQELYLSSPTDAVSRWTPRADARPPSTAAGVSAVPDGSTGDALRSHPPSHTTGQGSSPLSAVSDQTSESASSPESPASAAPAPVTSKPGWRPYR